MVPSKRYVPGLSLNLVIDTCTALEWKSMFAVQEPRTCLSEEEHMQARPEETHKSPSQGVP